jgi:adenosylmethionine-8-amino-7-oxononanoate aminotransferase
MAHVGDVRQRGLMVGIELVRDRATREEFPHGLRAGHRVILEARGMGAILRPLGNVVVLMPPLAMSEGELQQLAGITLACIEKVAATLA